MRAKPHNTPFVRTCTRCDGRHHPDHSPTRHPPLLLLSWLPAVEATRGEAAFSTITVASSTIKLAKWPTEEFMELLDESDRVRDPSLWLRHCQAT